jgi:transcriptional regulator with XRE-family HTH domain
MMQLGESSRVRATQSGLQKLREARDLQRSDDGKRLTDERLAENANVSKSSVQRFFKGIRVNSDIALAITRALGLPLKDIINMDESETTFSYVERPPIESKCCIAIEKPGALIRIKAPQQMGKTLLLARILAHAREQDYQTVILSFETDTTVFNDLEKFSQWFCASVGKRLGLPNKLTDYWDDIFGCNDNSTAYFEEYLLAELTSPLVLALDRVDRVFEHPAIANDFCSLLRGWNDIAKRSDRSGAIWKQLRLIVVHSTEVYSSLDINRSPLANVGVIVPLLEFTSEQVQDLARRYGLDWVGNQEVEQLMAMVGGHPYLIQQAFEYLERQNVTLEEFLQIAPTEESPFSAHLRQHLWNLQQNPELATAFCEVVTNNQAVRIETAQAFKLQSMGLVQLQGNDCSPRCDLYRQYFSVRLAAT